MDWVAKTGRETDRETKKKASGRRDGLTSTLRQHRMHPSTRRRDSIVYTGHTRCSCGDGATVGGTISALERVGRSHQRVAIGILTSGTAHRTRPVEVAASSARVGQVGAHQRSRIFASRDQGACRGLNVRIKDPAALRTLHPAPLCNATTPKELPESQPMSTVLSVELIATDPTAQMEPPV